MGVMAQEVLRVHPEAVGERNGYLAVDDGRIGDLTTPRTESRLRLIERAIPDPREARGLELASLVRSQ